MIKRTAEKELNLLANQFKAVAVVGPRQSGKTTLVRAVFKDKPYVNLENPDLRTFASEDPRAFLNNYKEGAIFDEIQRVPDLFSYLQQILDESNHTGQFILTGSNNFLIQSNISQSLAGRVGYLFLMPLTLLEINYKNYSLNDILLRGSYPELYQKPEFDVSKYYANYIRTYIERDVRLIKNISNLNTFERFLRLCAGRVGQLLNINNLSTQVGVDNKTIDSWINILEASFIAFRLKPHHKNFNKRLIKMPKLYFYDTGLLSALLSVDNGKQLDLNPYKGQIFENFIVSEQIKRRYNLGMENNLYFWRDHSGHEVDLIIDKGLTLIPIEIKSGQTVIEQFFKGIKYWQKISGDDSGYVIYAGDQEQLRSNGIKLIPYFGKIDGI